MIEHPAQLQLPVPVPIQVRERGAPQREGRREFVERVVLSGATPSFASTFAPDTAIVVTRIEVRFATAPAACTRNAVLLVTDGTASGTTSLTLAAAGNDSGPINVAFAKGKPVHAGIAVSAVCGQPPALGNISVQYKAQ